LKAAADPLMEMCRQMIEMKRGSGEWEKDIFLINCSMYLQVSRRFGTELVPSRHS
jgi:hypothetical protein